MTIFLTGPNDFARKQALDSLIDRFAQKHGDAGLERIDGERFEAPRLPELLQSASLFAPQRLVVLRGAAANKSLWEVLGDWLDKIPQETTLIVVEPNADKRTRTYKQLKKLGEMQEYADLQPPQLAAWLQKTAGALGGTIDSRVAAYLVQQVGADQWRLYNELQKLAAYNPNITVAAINELVEAEPQVSAFELLDAVIARQPDRAADLLDKLSAIEDPYRLFGLLVSQVYTLAVVRRAGSKTADVIAKEAGLHPFAVRKMQGAARGMTAAEMRGVIESIARLDTQLKSSGAEPWVLVRQCLQKIAAR